MASGCEGLWREEVEVKRRCGQVSASRLQSARASRIQLLCTLSNTTHMLSHLCSEFFVFHIHLRPLKSSAALCTLTFRLMEPHLRASLQPGPICPSCERYHNLQLTILSAKVQERESFTELIRYLDGTDDDEGAKVGFELIVSSTLAS